MTTPLPENLNGPYSIIYSDKIEYHHEGFTDNEYREQKLDLLTKIRGDTHVYVDDINEFKNMVKGLNLKFSTKEFYYSKWRISEPAGWIFPKVRISTNN